VIVVARRETRNANKVSLELRAYSFLTMAYSQPVRAWARIRCQECGREDDSDERGWRAFLGDGDDGGDVVFVYCPQCAEREFGDD
jgi:hypothetical protein